MRATPLLLLLLCLMPLAAAAQAPPRAPGIDAADDRVPVDVAQLPWRAMGKVQSPSGGSCTGTLIGARLVLTAGHCIYQKALRQLLPLSSLHFLAGFSGGDFAAHARVVRFEHAPGLLAFLRGETRLAQDDWLVMVLDQPLGERFGFLKLARTPLPRGVLLQTAGYGQDHRLLLMADLDCRVTVAASVATPLFGHDCEVTHGNSGGSLLVRQDGEWRVAGIVQGLVRRDDNTTLGLAVDVAVLRDKIGAMQQAGNKEQQ